MAAILAVKAYPTKAGVFFSEINIVCLVKLAKPRWPWATSIALQIVGVSV